MNRILAAAVIFLASVCAQAANPMDSWAEYPRPAGAAPPLSIAFGNGIFVASGTNGTVITSTNGADWTLRNVGMTRELPLVKFVNGLFFLPCKIRTSFPPTVETLLVSSDGISWTNLVGTPFFTDITWDGSAFCATGVSDAFNSVSQLHRSTNLVDWISSNVTGATVGVGRLSRILYANGVFVGSLADGIQSLNYVSTNGLAWSSVPLSVSGGITISEFTYQGGLFFKNVPRALALPSGGVPVFNLLHYSSDGINWTRALYVRTHGTPLASKPALGGGYFVYPDGASILYTNNLPVPTNFSIIESNWARVDVTLSGPAESASSDIAFGNQVFVAVTLGKIIKSNPVEGTAGIRITRQPTAASVTVGGTTTFSVLAQGSDPISYQWRRNGTNLLGKTASTLTLTNASVEMAGSYDVVVTNPAGDFVSEAAALTVHFAEMLLYSGVTLRGNIGDRFLIEFHESVSPETWHTLSTVTLSEREYIYYDRESATNSQRYYRVTFQSP